MTPTARALLALLRADGPAPVCALAERLGQPVGLLEAFLGAFQTMGLVASGFEGASGILIWRARPTCSIPGAHAPVSNPQHEGAAP
jgi:hypothetical protein